MVALAEAGRGQVHRDGPSALSLRARAAPPTAALLIPEIRPRYNSPLDGTTPKEQPLMLLITLLGLATVSATVLLHAFGTAWWLARLRRRKQSGRPVRELFTPLSILVKTALVLIGLHVAEVFLWAVLLRFLPGSTLRSLEEAMYFSFTTFTTLGYGDITLEEPWRLLTGIEALSGILLIGWSTALSFVVITRILEAMDRSRQPER